MNLGKSWHDEPQHLNKAEVMEVVLVTEHQMYVDSRPEQIETVFTHSKYLLASASISLGVTMVQNIYKLASSAMYNKGGEHCCH